MSKPKAKALKPMKVTKRLVTTNLTLLEREMLARKTLLGAARQAERGAQASIAAAVTVLSRCKTTNTPELLKAQLRTAEHHLASANFSLSQAIFNRDALADLNTAEVFEPIKEAK